MATHLTPPWQHQGMPTGRFAPSPTGDLHVGNLRTALAAWLFARSSGSRFLLRFEDLDRSTATTESETDQIADLHRLGIDWDAEPIRQSDRFDLYHDMITDLTRAGLTYRCWCSRREVREAAAAPHNRHGMYPGTCRDLSARRISELEESCRPAALRLRCSSIEVTVNDRLRETFTAEVDDFVLRRGDGVPAYNLAVVIDDSDQDVEEVVRADDLLDSTPRHVHLQNLLDLPTPAYAHMPLVLASDGNRLAKRDGAVTLADRLALGDTPGRVVAVLAASLGLDVPEHEVSPEQLIQRFEPSGITLEPWSLTSDQTTYPW